MALIHSSVSARLWKRRETARSGRGNWGTELAAVSGWVYGTESFAAPFQGIHASFQEHKSQKQVWWDWASWKWRRFWSSFWQNGEVESRPLELRSRCLHTPWHQEKNLHGTWLISEEILVVKKTQGFELVENFLYFLYFSSGQTFLKLFLSRNSAFDMKGKTSIFLSDNLCMGCEGQQREERVCQLMVHRLTFSSQAHFPPVVKFSNGKRTHKKPQHVANGLFWKALQESGK